MSNKLHILALDRRAIALYIVDPAVQDLKIIASADIRAQGAKTLREATKNLFSQLEHAPTSIRILLSDTLAYVTQISLNATGISKNKEREAIFNKVQEIIPETLNEKEWDYKIDAKTEDTTTVTVFAPVIEMYRPLTETLQTLGIEAEALESVSMAKQRHTNPVIGLALKTDIQGKDNEVLNIQEKKEVGAQHQLFSPKNLVGIFLIGVATIAALTYIFGAQYSTQKNVLPLSEKNQEEVKKDAAKQLLFAPNDIRIQIINSSGAPEATTTAIVALEKKGFVEIEATSSAESALQGFSLQLKDGPNRSQLEAYVQEALAQLILDAQTRAFALDESINIESSPLQSDAKFDLLVLVGK